MRISSVRAGYYFCDNLMSAQKTQLLSPILPLMYEGVMAIALAYGTEVLGVSLDSMEIILRVKYATF